VKASKYVQSELEDWKASPTLAIFESSNLKLSITDKLQSGLIANRNVRDLGESKFILVFLQE